MVIRFWCFICWQLSAVTQMPSSESAAPSCQGVCVWFDIVGNTNVGNAVCRLKSGDTYQSIDVVAAASVFHEPRRSCGAIPLAQCREACSLFPEAMVSLFKDYNQGKAVPYALGASVIRI